MRDKANKIRHVRVEANSLTVEFADGRALVTPLSHYPTLQRASDEDRAVFEVYGRSIHWPRLDVDLGVEGCSLARANWLVTRTKPFPNPAVTASLLAA